MVDYKVKIGLAPCRRNVGPPLSVTPGGIWSKEAALDMKNVVVPYILKNFSSEHIEFVDLDWLNEDGMMYSYEQAAVIAERFASEKIDALFIVNVNFGDEEVAAKLAKLCDVPTLIWAPRDVEFGDTEDKRLDNPVYGWRLLDAQCGLFAVSKLLQRLHVKFTHIPTCDVDDPGFKEAFEDFAAVACMLKNWRTMRVLQLGNRPKLFTSMMFNEDELLERFGIEVFPYSASVALAEVTRILETRDHELDAIVKRMRDFYPGGDGGDPSVLRKNAALYVFYTELFETTGCSAICPDASFARSLGVSSNIDIALCNNDKNFMSFESDMHGVIQMVIMSSATFGEKVPFFGEFTVNHPTNPNAELIWHTNIFAPSLADPSLVEPYIQSGPGGLGLNAGFEVARGTYTIGRFDCMDGKYAMLLGNFKAVPGPFTRGPYIWGEFQNWKKFESAVMYGPYVHHMVEVEGDERILGRLKEFCRYTAIYADVPDERSTPFAPFFYNV
ncbi:MAG: hypothetical protein ACOX3V_05455 [Bacillota bacterium]|jgi:L-fucose isomerase-like protein